MIEMKQYRRESAMANITSAIFLSLHMGQQVVLWEAKNYPRIKMKMIWFYVIQDQLQPFCATELPPLKQQSNQKLTRGDVALGFEQGQIRIFDLSKHFSNIREGELKNSFFESKSNLTIHSQIFTEPVTENKGLAQIPNKKCGALIHLQSLKLTESEVISAIFDGGQNYLLISTISCQIYLLNYITREYIYGIDLNDRVPNNMCYFMQPYFKFDSQLNPIVLFMDRVGICLVNLKEKEVYKMQVYEDQAAKPTGTTREHETEILEKNYDEKRRAMNIDMWQRYNDCIMCEAKSIPNTQGVMIQHSTRNLLIGLNKTLEIWSYEKIKERKRSEKPQGIFIGQPGQ